MPRFIYESSEACVWNTEALRALIDLVRRADVERGKTSLWNVPDLLYRMPREDVVFGELARRFEKAGWAAVLLTPDQGPVRSILKQHTEDLDGICVLRYGMALEMNADLRQKAAGKQANPPEAPDGTISAFPAFLALSAKATAFSTKTGEEFFRFNCLGGEFLWGMHASTGRIFSWLSAPGELERAERAVVRKAFGSLDFAAR